MKKFKLQDRIAMIYIALFLILMLMSNVLIMFFLKQQSYNSIDISMEKKKQELNLFFEKVESYSNQYTNFTLEFNLKVEGDKVVYPKPFNPGEENFYYILKVKRDGTIRYPLNSLNNIDSNKPNLVDANYTINTIERAKLKSYDTRGKIIDLKQSGGLYRVIKITKNIKGVEFDVYVLKNVDEQNKIYSRLQYLVLLFTLLGIVLIVVFSKMISKVILRPINNVIETARSITAEDLSKRIEIITEEDELGRLSKIINKMLDRLENSFENQSKFVSDASHELRTPLAIIKGYAELIQRRKMEDVEVFDESIDAIINEIDNMKDFVQRLLFLAKGETSKLDTTFTVISGEDLVTHVYTDAKISWKSHDFELERADEYYIRGDKSLLQQAIRALIENAVKYSQQGTKVYIYSEKVGDVAKISIRDEGIGIPEKDIKKIFERFYRVDESRNKTTGGTGLGLAIVKRIIDLHKGKTSAESKLNVGTKIIIEIPIIK